MTKFKFLGKIHEDKNRLRRYHRFQLSTGHIVEIYSIGRSDHCHARIWDNRESKKIVGSSFNLSAKAALGKVRMAVAQIQNPDIEAVKSRLRGEKAWCADTVSENVKLGESFHRRFFGRWKK